MPADKDGSWRPPQPVPFKPGEKLRDKSGQNPVDDERGLFVIHAVHMHTGKVLWFCGHVEYLDYPLVAYVFDPRKPTAPPVRKPFPNGADLFCCFCVQLADGRILVVGGSQLDHLSGTTFDRRTDYRGSAGSSTIVIFDPRKEVWEKPDPGRKLLQGRWYPTALVLGDGSVIVVSGRRESLDAWPDVRLAEWFTNRGIANVVEHLRPPKYRPEAVTGANRAIPIYPGIHLAPDDRLYTTHTTWGQEIDEPPTLSLTIVPPPSGAPKGTAASGTWTQYVLPAAKAEQPEREEGMSVMLPVVLDPATKARDPNSVGKFLVVGGGFAVDSSGVSLVRRAVVTPAPPWTITTPGGLGPLAFHRQEIATPQPVEILDTSLAGAPRWTAVPGLTHPRINGHCVLLPDATVLILGGHDTYKWNARASSTLAAANGVPRTNPTLEVEIYTPGAGFHVGAPMAHPRMYHSIAMLLVDGSVIVAGGADPNEHEASLEYPRTFNGRTYMGTARLLLKAAAGETELKLEDTSHVYGAAFTAMPVGTKVIIDRGPSEIRTTLAGLREQPPPSDSDLVILDIDTPLPRDITDGTRVDFEPATSGTPIPRVNEWSTNFAVQPPQGDHAQFSTPLNRKDYEIYQPPYFHKADSRPVLPSLKAGEVQVRYGATFTVRTPDAARITRVAIMRPAAVTHHTDTEQRFIELPFTANGSTSLSIKMVPGTDSSLVPPGYYMLWILAGALPCVEARFIQVTGAPALRSPTVPVEVAQPAPPPPPPEPTTPAPPAEDDDSSCPLTAAATTMTALSQLAYLRLMRTELSASRAGQCLLAVVNPAYYAFGAPLARRLATRARWRAAVRAVALRPLAAAVRAVDALCGRGSAAVRGRQLAVALSLVGVGGVLLSPAVALAGAVHVAIHRGAGSDDGGGGHG
ncbi:galactose oxidase-like domain-containing protein [Actinacidiphila glaucinigra]|uniref:galactose oxidase-like domain-containing protein n=1 Tax=Actinacidiphila glaucinigra TaxID=235986 RepID=UPI0035E0669C